MKNRKHSETEENLNSWKLTIRYDGARYKGWQRLGADAKGDTIQAKLESVMSTLCDHPVLVTGSGRTDAGVHALAQAAHFRTSAALSASQILEHAARYLPEDIAVIQAQTADNRFHARYKATSKQYLYRIDTGLWPDPFERKYAWHVPEKLNWDTIAAAAGHLEGTHDFSAFTAMKSKKKSAVKTLRSISIRRPDPSSSIAEIRLTADGFLHNMVRIIVGTLIEAGQGKYTPETVLRALESRRRENAGMKAPAKGLFLEEVLYQ